MPLRDLTAKITLTDDTQEAVRSAERGLEDVGNAAQVAGSQVDRMSNDLREGERELDDLSDEARAAARNLEDLADEARNAERQVDDLGDTSSDTARDLKGLDGGVGGVGRTAATVGGDRGGVSLLSGSIKGLGAAAGGAVVLDGLKQLGDRVLTLTDQAQMLADQYAGGEGSGSILSALLQLQGADITFEDLRGAFGALSNAIAGEDDGLIALLDKAGISFEEFETLSPIEQLNLLDKAFGGAAEGPEELRLAMALLGEKGPAILSTLNEDTQTKFTDKQIRQISTLKREWRELREDIEAEAIRIAAAAASAAGAVIEAIQEPTAENIATAAGDPGVQTALAIAGSPAGEALLGPLSSLAGPLATVLRTGGTDDPVTGDIIGTGFGGAAAAVAREEGVTIVEDEGSLDDAVGALGSVRGLVNLADSDSSPAADIIAGLTGTGEAGAVPSSQQVGRTRSSGVTEYSGPIVEFFLDPDSRKALETIAENTKDTAENTDTGGTPNLYVSPTGTLPATVPGVSTGGSQ